MAFGIISTVFAFLLILNPFQGAAALMVYMGISLIIWSIRTEPFETYLGFLHGIRYGRKSLALDMIEEFWQPMIDRFVLLLFNKHMIGKDDFEFSQEGRVILNEEGFRKFCFSCAPLGGQEKINLPCPMNKH